MDSLDVFLEREVTGIEARAEVKKRVLLILATERERCAALAYRIAWNKGEITLADELRAAIRKGE